MPYLRECCNAYFVVDVTRAMDEGRIAWSVGDIIENRPALSRWHPDYAQAFNAHMETATK